MRHGSKFGFVFLALGVLAAAGCRTTDDVADESKITASIPVPQGFDAVLPLVKDDGQNLYIKLLGVELASGIKVPKDQLHTIQGVYQCTQDAALTNCSYRVRLSGELSPHQPFDRTWTDKLFAFSKAARPDLATERLLMGDLICDYVGKKSPPYDMEDVKCSVRYPRKVTETIFAEKYAEEMSELLRGTASFGKEVVKLSGALNCRYVEGSKRAVCVVRAVNAGVLQETLKEISAVNATYVAGKLRTGYADFRALSGASEKDAMPREMTATLICSVDSSKVETDGSRHYVCSAGF